MAGASSRPCTCGSGEYPVAEYDGHGIFLFYACGQCRERQLKKYRPDIKERYECDEPIDED